MVRKCLVDQSSLFDRFRCSGRTLKEIKRIMSRCICKICRRLHIKIVSIVAALMLDKRNVVFFELDKELRKLDLLVYLHMIPKILRTYIILRFDYHSRDHP